jgi:hypothetical protein
MAHGSTPHQSVDEQDAAAYLGYTPGALRKWRREGRGPAYIRSGRSVRYRIPDLEVWQASHRVETRESREPTGRSRRPRAAGAAMTT